MHARKAVEALKSLLDEKPDVATFASAAALFDGLGHLQQHARNGIVSEKLTSARGWFEILCGIGEDGNWSEDQIRHFIFADLAIVEREIAPGGDRFKGWHQRT